jgi:predicted membrane channel-forming protein YqfA (hemolysin III family)
VSALTYVAMGWIVLPYIPVLAAAVDLHVLLLVSAPWGLLCECCVVFVRTKCVGAGIWAGFERSK